MNQVCKKPNLDVKLVAAASIIPIFDLVLVWTKIIVVHELRKYDNERKDHG
jgi:hypothetical protein